MKCGFCGNELEHGAEICPNCGMIISLGDESESTNDKVVESVYNVFKSNVTNEKAHEEKALELEADPTEEKVEFIVSLPEFDETAAEPIKEEIEVPSFEDAPESPAAQEPLPAEEAPAQPEIDMSLPEMEEIPLPDTLLGDRISGDIYSHSEDIPEEPAAEEVPAEEAAAEEIAEEAIAEAAEEPEEEIAEVTEDAEEEEEKLGIRVPESNYIYAEYDDYGKIETEEDKKEKTEKNEQAKKNLDKISPDEKKKPAGKKPRKKGIDGIKIEGVLGVAIVLIVILFGCAYAVKNDMIPILSELFEVNETTTTEQAESTSAEETSEEETSEETSATEEETTTEEVTTTQAETTTEEVTTEKEETTAEKETTTKATTTKPTTTKPTTTKPSTTKPTTRPTTTKPTTKPSTTKPTTKPSTTKDPYGINNVTVKKPSGYLSKSYTAYITTEGVTLRNAPSATGERILFLSKGADVKVLAKEKGFLYVRSNRYGVYGWVDSSYAANKRPETSAVIVKGTVAPDKKYDTVVTKFTTNGLNIRKGPGTNYDVIGLIPISYPVKVIGYKSGVSGWVYVEDTTYGYTGWVSTAYIK